MDTTNTNQTPGTQDEDIYMPDEAMFSKLAEVQLREEQRRVVQQRAEALQADRQRQIDEQNRRREIAKMADQLTADLDPAALDKVKLAMEKSIEAYLRLASMYDDCLMEARNTIGALTAEERKEHGIEQDANSILVAGRQFSRPKPQTALGTVIRANLLQYYPRYQMNVDFPIE